MGRHSLPLREDDDRYEVAMSWANSWFGRAGISRAMSERSVTALAGLSMDLRGESYVRALARVQTSKKPWKAAPHMTAGGSANADRLRQKMKRLKGQIASRPTSPEDVETLKLLAGAYFAAVYSRKGKQYALAVSLHLCTLAGELDWWRHVLLPAIGQRFAYV